MSYLFFFFFFNDTATTEIYTLSLHDALPISSTFSSNCGFNSTGFTSTFFISGWIAFAVMRSEEHTSELQSRLHLVCRLLLEKKKINTDCVNLRPLLSSAELATSSSLQ